MTGSSGNKGEWRRARRKAAELEEARRHGTNYGWMTQVVGLATARWAG